MLHHFLRETGAGRIELDEGAVEFLKTYGWPGNVRELKNLAERISVMCDGDRLTEADLRGLVKENPETAKNNQEKTSRTAFQDRLPPDILKANYNKAKELFEKHYLEFQLSRNGGIISRTAEAIGIYPSNLHAKLRKYGIIVPGNSGHGDSVRTEG
jgi:two-component system nitrogen regulation response regulator NtrX